ncbi:dTDP-glucose 4,6-dehydratase [Paracerasibacillus soli]|uniref:dTDP-glucose 4,6-dehydratase n=1 Tax=Paracerasibacillus soli TaxID=480284 RepID=A0ABU5CTL2_9BACI|nr:dTDP-glucose 4,6-dehydratase [Virgibacillus soli]MDY0409197.1 dTDP-glucose 4,6-dehydratase [Virgibacillus soli]
MRLLVTGGAGFIGGNFIHYMIEKYAEVQIVNVDSLTYAGDIKKHQHLDGNSQYTFIKGDITNQALMRTVFEKQSFDYIVHFAAESHVDRSIVDPHLFLQTNVIGTQLLLALAKEFQVQKFIHISTDEVYGELAFSEKETFTEQSPLAPNNPYSASKASADLFVRAYFETYDLPMNIVRCSNNFGPYQLPEKLIPLTITRLLQGQRVPIYGDGQQIRDWLHCHDYCAAIDLIMEKGKSGEVYNVGSQNERTNIAVVRQIIDTLALTDDFIQFVPDH